MTFTLGRQLSDSQAPIEAAIAGATQQNGSSLRAAVEALVVSDIFRMRRPQGATEVAP